jgi:hypothetical protein
MAIGLVTGLGKGADDAEGAGNERGSAQLGGVDVGVGLAWVLSCPVLSPFSRGFPYEAAGRPGYGHQIL